MKLHSFSIFIKDASKNMLLNKLMTLATIITLSAGIFLFGITSSLTFNVFSITEKLEKDFKIQAYLDETLDTDDINEIGLEIQNIENVLSTEFLSKEEAFAELKSRYENPEFLDGIDDGNILRNSFKVTLSDLSQSKSVVMKLEKIKGIAKITKLDDEMTKFVNIMNKIQLGTVVISIILALLAVLIITNTINMSIFARRKQINIMKYVGATDWYIRWPFIFEGTIIGIISSALSLTGIYFLYNKFFESMGNYSETLGILTTNALFPIIVIIVTVLGISLGCLGSIFSIRKHLKV